MNYNNIFKRFDKITVIFINNKGRTLKKEIQINSLSDRHYTATERETKSRFFLNLDSEDVIYFNAWNIPIYTAEERQMYFCGKGVFYMTGKSLRFIGEYIEKNAKGRFNKGNFVFIRNLKAIKQEVLMFPSISTRNPIINEYKLQQELAAQFEEYESKAMTTPPRNKFYDRWKTQAA